MDMVEHPPLLDHRPFGHSGRARGINDIGQVTRRAADREVFFALAHLQHLFIVERLWTQLGWHLLQRMGECRRKRRRGQDDAAAAVLDYPAQPRRWMMGIEGQIGPSRFVDGQDGDQKGDAPLSQ